MFTIPYLSEEILTILLMDTSYIRLAKSISWFQVLFDNTFSKTSRPKSDSF